MLRTRVLQRTVLIGHYSLALFECIKKYSNFYTNFKPYFITFYWEEEVNNHLDHKNMRVK